MVLELMPGYKDIRRRRFVRRARREKRRWFAAAFRGRNGVGEWRKGIGRVGAALAWGILAVLVLVMSGGMFWTTGKGMGAYEEDSGYVLEDGEGWSGEFFGVEVRVRDGRIVLFREKKELREREEEGLGDGP